jgi:hypothetical protein
MKTISFHTKLDFNKSKITGWTREHWEETFYVLMRGIINSASPACARQVIPGPRSHHGRLADELEGFTRSFIMAGPWLKNGTSSFEYEGRKYDVAEFYRKGILAGTDPKHKEYWGDIVDYAQHLVEMAALSWGLYLSQDLIWKEFSSKEKKQVADYLYQCTKVKYHQNNWLLFNVITNSVLKKLNMPYSQEQIDSNLSACDHMYIGDGWYRDGNINRIDYYNAWAFLYYYLQWVILDGNSKPEIAKIHIERAKLFVNDLRYFIAKDGATPCFGRSMIYRFAFLAPVALGQHMDILEITSGEAKTLCNSVMKFFFEQPILTDTDHLSLGYLKPAAEILEHYSCGGSPYWAAKAYNLLLIPNRDSFWSAEEEELPIHKGSFCKPLNKAGIILTGDHATGHIQLINHKSYHDKPEYNPKYTKFAYSSIFSYEARAIYKNFNCDNVLQFSDDGINFRQRWEIKNLYCVENFSASSYPMFEADFEGNIFTSTIVKDNFLINIHEVLATKPLFLKEGGYPLGYDDGNVVIQSVLNGEAAFADGKYTFLQNLLGYSNQVKASQFCDDVNGSNVRYSKSVVPVLTRSINAEKVYLASLVQAGIGNPQISTLMQIVQSFKCNDNKVHLKFSDGVEIFVQVGEIQEVSFSLREQKFKGKIVFAYKPSNGFKAQVLFEDGEYKLI